MEGCDTETTGGAANSNRSLKKPGRLQRRKPKNEKHEMEVEIEKVVKAQTEAQSAAEVADREEQIAHKESRTTSSGRRTRRNTSRKWKLNSRRSMMASSLSWLIPSARRIALAEDHEPRTPKISSSSSESIMNRWPRSDRQHRKPRTTRILRSRAVYPRTHNTT